MDGLERKEMKQIWASSPSQAPHGSLLLRDLRGTRTLCLHVNVKHVMQQSNTSPMEKGIVSLHSWRREDPGKSLPASGSLCSWSCMEPEPCRAPSTSTKHQHCSSSICPFFHLPNISKDNDLKSPASISGDFSVTKSFTSLG